MERENNKKRRTKERKETNCNKIKDVLTFSMKILLDVFLSCFFIFCLQGQNFNCYDKVILAAHWSLIDDFIVKNQEETGTNYVSFYGCLLSFYT